MGIQATDRDRTLFLKGFKLSDQGKNEDPTYLGFKFVFDFGTLPVDPTYGWAPSPLLRKNSYTSGNGASFASGLENPFGQPQYDFGGSGGPIYYSAYEYLLQREANFGPSNRLKRANALLQFQGLLNTINTNSPWFFQSITGLDSLSQVPISGFQTEEGFDDFNTQRTAGKKIEVTCLESINLRISALANLYNQAVFDADNMRWLVPRNLRKFTMWIFVTEIRNFFKTSRLTGSSTVLATLDNLSNVLTTDRNPGSNIKTTDLPGNYSVNGIDFQPIENISGNPGNSFTSFVSNVFGQSGLQNDVAAFRNQQDQSGIKPVLVYECQQCEFDFSNSTPLKSSVDMGSSSAEPEGQSFTIHIGKVRTKNQYPNIRQDKKPLILADGATQDRSSVEISDDSLSVEAIASLGNELITNFTSAAVNDLINEGINQFVSPALGGISQGLLGNIYSFNPSELGRLFGTNGFTFNGAQDFLNGAADVGIDNIFKGDLPNPQKLGLGGPPQRVYPPLSPPEDVYPRVPGTDQGVPDRVYPAPGGDVYSNVPGADLGVPGRVYPAPGGDVYSNVPGADLGVPDRVYPAPGGDVYSNVPGADLGVPGRVYPAPGGDVYSNVPGADLGVPDRVYPAPGGDAYSNVPGADLGVPDRVYPAPGGDVYQDVPGADLGVPDRVYPAPGGDVYQDVPGADLGVPDRVYPVPDGDVYQDVPGSDLGVPDRVYSAPAINVYEDQINPSSLQPERIYQQELLQNIAGELRSPENSFSQPPSPVYESPRFQTPVGNLGQIYPVTVGDFIVEPPLNLGNNKPENKFNISLGTFNPPQEEVEP
jgi:hypothetical protein